jgi:DNA/RNA endonuclease G (NUC1)
MYFDASEWEFSRPNSKASILSDQPTMKLHQRLLTGLLAFALAGSVRAEIGVSYQMQLGNATNATADTTNHSNYLIQRTVEAMDYDDTLGSPNWVSWDLISSDVGPSGRGSYTTDTSLPAGFYAVRSSDYTYSGYDRGHMCPSGDRTDNTTDNDLVFLMSNFFPQTPDNNQGVWESFESYCRTQASAGYEVLLTTGGSGYTGAYIPSGKVAIPGYTWKIAAFVPLGSGSALSRVNMSTRVVALKIPNISGIRSNPWTMYVTSANQIQTDTGYNFFTALPSSVATVLRAKVDGATAPSISSFSPGSGPMGSSVTISGSSFTSASLVTFNGTSASFTVNSASQITATVPTGATTGTIAVFGPGGTDTSASSFTVTTSGTGTVTISQVYGGGGNSGATYRNDFIELYNSGTASVDLSTYAVQYTSASGSTWQETTLSGTILPGHHYLIQEAAGAGGTTNLPAPQVIGSIAMSASSGKIALTKTQTLLTVGNPVGSSAVVDFVGYGSSDAYEGSGAAPALTNTTAALRANAGATDTDNNADDFTAGTPTPRNN